LAEAFHRKASLYTIWLRTAGRWGMPTNLPPQYFEAEQRYRRGRSAPERLAALQDMLAIMPKHKGTDHLKAGLRAKMAQLMEEIERPRRSGGGQAQPFSLRKEGAGQAVLIGLPNVGKSQLLATLTGAGARVADYPFTTKVPLPGMLQFENIRIQLVDTPAINDRDMQTRLFSLLRNADVLLIVLDLSADALEQVRTVTEELQHWGYKLLGKDEVPDPEETRVQKRVLLVGNKADAEGALDQFQLLESEYGNCFPVLMVAALERVGLEELAQETFKALSKVRVYTKAPSGQPDYNEPVVLPAGSRVEEAAEHLHKEWKRKLRYAVLWGSGKFEGQHVGRDYVLADGDVIELHG
jgi:small GTP-binding protein